MCAIELHPSWRNTNGSGPSDWVPYCGSHLLQLRKQAHGFWKPAHIAHVRFRDPWLVLPCACPDRPNHATRGGGYSTNHSTRLYQEELCHPSGIWETLEPAPTNRGKREPSTRTRYRCRSIFLWLPTSSAPPGIPDPWKRPLSQTAEGVASRQLVRYGRADEASPCSVRSAMWVVLRQFFAFPSLMLRSSRAACRPCRRPETHWSSTVGRYLRTLWST